MISNNVNKSHEHAVCASWIAARFGYIRASKVENECCICAKHMSNGKPCEAHESLEKGEYAKTNTAQ